jgi:hypothetical protein
MAEKATRVEYGKRIKEVECLLLDGIPRANILESITEKHGVSEHMVEVYITEAYKRITAINKATIDENRGWVLRNYIELFREARGKSDINAARGCLDSIAKVLGLLDERKEEPAPKPLDVNIDTLEQDALGIVH